METRMRRLLFLLCALGAVSVALAQSKPAPWSNLGALHPGDKIRLVEADSKSVSGAFQSFSDNSLSIQNKAGAQTIDRKDIRSVKLLKNVHRMRNTLIGAGVGAGAGAGIGAAGWESHGFLGGKGAGAAVGAVIGTVGGAVVGAVLPSHATIYTMPVP
jgi:outer membrane lipoprotein SlyB